MKSDPETISKLVAVNNGLESVGSKPGLDEKASNLEDVDFIGKQQIKLC